MSCEKGLNEILRGFLLGEKKGLHDNCVQTGKTAAAG